ncbi:DNA polymerase III subunit gamma and tau [Arthrobacter sp. AD-310]
MTVTTALYRRYRPDSFADVIGQEHVTEPLMTALRKNRVNHAYLFSGPRGCGKTTSARILARCLNCAQGPTDTPCGQCPSCIELARGGPGSLDVIEIDAASHGGVDDARDLRERATYAPVRDRYKIFIIDEAHMVTSAGFNALLKIVEEPPEHIKFIFATTEPDKVIGTIRSRTHHYPFRLVPPEPLMAYLELLCNQENVPVAPGVLSLVIRAGGGSVRDSLSVLDQLMAGAGPNGLDYELAVALLGYTHASLLDDVVEAMAASDAATVFRAVDRVIQTGHDPRRFVEDLLERFRDLIIVKAMPESAQTILRGMPADQIARLQNQAHSLGSAELSRAADVTNTALTEMTGATSPRLHLELLCARILLPSSDQNERGMAARIDRVERRLSYAGNDAGAAAGEGAGASADAGASGVPAQAQRVSPAPPVATEPAPARPSTPEPAAAQPSAALPVVPQPAAESAAVGTDRQGPAAAGDAPAATAGRSGLTPPRVSTSDWPVDDSAGARPPAERPAAARPAPQAGPASVRAEPAGVSGQPGSAGAPAPAGEARAPASPASAATPPAAASARAGMGDVEVLRRAWPDVLQTLAKIKRSTWALVEPNAQVSSFDGAVLTLAFTTQGLAGAFGRADHSENLRQAIHKTMGIDCQVNAVAGGASQASSEPNPKAPASPPATAVATSADVAWGLAPAPAPTAPDQKAPAPAASSGADAAAPAEPLRADAPAPAPSVPVHTAGRPGSGSSAVAGTDGSAPVPAPVRSEPSGAPAAGPAARPAPASPAGGTKDYPAANARPYPELAGDYSYSDDDWGPPRDEDAPPLEEEPPADWEPTPQRTRPAPVTTPPDTAPSGNQGNQPAVGAAGPGTAGPATTPGTAVSAPASTAQDSAHDPWTRAVEQAPGVWVVGNESNVGKAPATADEQSGQVSVPRYEPATAQVPPSIPVTSTSSPAPARTPEYAMASAPAAGPATATPQRPAPAAGPAAAPSTAGTLSPVGAPPAGNSGARQSLYQRLSNSPEAEAGRAKAPARATAAGATYVQDIPSADDETIEESGVFGRAAVERILGGKLIEERSHDGSPLPPRY